MHHTPRFTVRALSILATTLILSPAALADPPATPADWTRLLADQPADRRLEVHLDSGASFTGYPVRVPGEGVALAATPGGEAAHPLDSGQILRVRQERSSASRGWKAGGAIGAGAGAVFGFLFTAFAIEVGDDRSWDNATLPYIAGPVSFAAVGTVAGGGIGALIGSGGRSWYELDPVPARRARWRLEPQLGLAGADDLNWEMYDSTHLRFYVPRQFGSWFEIGPDLGWMKLGTSMESWQGETATVNDTWQIGITMRFRIPAGGLEPYVTWGLAHYDRDDSWLGVNTGLGLRLGRATAEVRGHVGSSDIDQMPTNDMTTVAFGWGFDL